MNNIIQLYDIKLDEKLTIELLYISKDIISNLEIYLEEDKSASKIKFDLIKEYYDEEKKLIGYKCSSSFNIDKLSRCFLKLKNNDHIFNLNWYNNQSKSIDFQNNKFSVFNNNYQINLFNDGLEIIRKKLYSKLIYNINKMLYGFIKYKKIFVYRLFKSKEKSIIICDRVREANDNGEALFKYICFNDKKLAKNTYYLIDKSSDKYEELKKIGNVLKFGSIKHKIKFINSKIICTSYIGNTVSIYNPFTDNEMNLYRDIINKKVMFLQHGIIMSDFHLSFNRPRMCIDRFVVSTNQEYENIKNGYLYEENQILKSGMARYDLLKTNNKNKILVFFTWRKWLVNLPNEDFEKSEYFVNIKQFLEDKKIIRMLMDYNLKIDLVIHSELTKFYNCFSKFNNNYINILKSSETNFSKEFNDCKLLITDYSSVHFDVSYQYKPVIYYQFDFNEFLNNHTSSGLSDFSYVENGFGEVVSTTNELSNLIEKYKTNNFEMDKKYIKRVDETFFYSDKLNSKRITLELMKLYNEDSKNYRFNNVQ